MKKILLFSFCFCIFYYANGQNTSYDLSTYKLPDLKRHSLETTFNFAGRNQSYKPVDQTKAYETLLSGNLEIMYNSYLNTTARQTENVGYLHVISENTENKGYNEKTKITSFNPSIYFSLNNKCYKDYDKIFFGLDVTGIGNYNHYKNDQTSTDYKGTELSFGMPLKFGFGRIDQVQDARHAIYILEELKTQNRFSGDLSNENITSFAQHISKLKNKRFFDERIRRIYEIESVDSFLQTNNLVEKSDARYFTTLNDMWYFGGFPIRNAGSRFAFVMAPGVGYSKTTPLETDFISKTFFISTGIEYDYEKPINLKWQNSVSMKAFYQVLKGNLDLMDQSKINMPNIQFVIKQNFGYYPNTRTYLNFEYGGKYAHIFDKGDEVNKVIGGKGEGFMIFSGLDAYYYISPRFRFTANFSMNYQNQKESNEVMIYLPDVGKYIVSTPYAQYFTRSFYCTGNIGITYSIF